MSTRTKIKPEPDSNYSELLRDGLSTLKTYVVLKQKNRSPIYLAFRPITYRLHPYVFYVGGKLSAFPDYSHESWNELEPEERLKLLKKSFNLPQDRVHERRVGSNVGIYVAAGNGDGEQTIDKVVTKTVVKNILDAIEEKLGVEIENKIDVSKYLINKFNDQIASVFNTYSHQNKLPHRTVGKKSEILFGQSALGGGQELSEFLVKYGLDKLEPVELGEED